MGTYTSGGGSTYQYTQPNSGNWNTSTANTGAHSGSNTTQSIQSYASSSTNRIDPNDPWGINTPPGEFDGWTNQKAMDILYTNEAKVDAADGNSDKWGSTEGLIAIASNTKNEYSADLKAAARYILGNRELLNKLAGSDGLFGAGCDSDPVTAAAHKFMDWGKGHQQDDELYVLSNDTSLKSYGGNTSKGFKTDEKEMTTSKALRIMAANRDTLDKADGNANKWANKQGLENIITNSGNYDKNLVAAVKHVKDANGGQVWSDLFNGDDLFAVGDFFDAGKARWQEDEVRNILQKYA